MNRTYYFIDYCATIDAIKYRVLELGDKVQGEKIPDKDKIEFFCPRCKAEYTQEAVLDFAIHQETGQFACGNCGSSTVHDPNRERAGHQQSTRYNEQFKFLTTGLIQIDDVKLPVNTFEKALASAVKVVRPDTNPANETAPVDSSAAKPTAVRGMANVGPTSISVTVTTSEGPTEADIAAEQARKVKIATQNAMPNHFTHSTITGEQVKFVDQPILAAAQSLESDKKKISLDTSTADGDDDEVAYFAQLKAAQLKEAAQEQEEEDETDDEEDDDFEDVVPTGSGAATPASFSEFKSTSTPITNGLPGVLKKSGSVSGSGTSTGATSPVTGPGTPNEEGRPAKRVRIAEQPTPKEEDESEEDEVFEDV